MRPRPWQEEGRKSWKEVAGDASATPGGGGSGGSLLRVVIEGRDGEVDDVGECSEGGVAEGACKGEGLGGQVASEMVVVVVGGTEVEEEYDERAVAVEADDGGEAGDEVGVTLGEEREKWMPAAEPTARPPNL